MRCPLFLSNDRTCHGCLRTRGEVVVDRRVEMDIHSRCCGPRLLLHSNVSKFAKLVMAQ